MNSNNSWKIMTVNSFKEELNHVTARVIAKINGLQKEGPGDVAIDHGYLVQPNAINVTAGLGPMFRRLPREIRDMIYGEMLASGQPQFLRASKIMNQEGTSLISKHGVYRINIGFGSMANCPTITQHVADTVQNLHLRVNMMDYASYALGRYPENEILQMFSDSKICRKVCGVSFEGRSTSQRLVASEVLHSLKSFTGFEEVTLSINTGWFNGIVLLDHLHAWQINKTQENWHINLDRACLNLEPELGTAYWVQKSEGPQLVFHPRCSGQDMVRDSSGKEKSKWVKWEDVKDDGAI